MMCAIRVAQQPHNILLTNMCVLDVLDEVAQAGKRDAASIELADVDQEHGHSSWTTTLHTTTTHSAQPHNTTYTHTTQTHLCWLLWNRYTQTQGTREEPVDDVCAAVGYRGAAR